jgi:hypothetical protein
MFSFKEKATAIAEIPNQVKTMTVVVVMVGLVSLIALLMATVAVRNAN